VARHGFLRNEKDFGQKFPEVMDSIAQLMSRTPSSTSPWDEKGRSSFQLLHAYAIGQQWPPILFYALDLLQINGKDLKNFPCTIGKRSFKSESKSPRV
jgi:ATP-dependent DNA ligase